MLTVACVLKSGKYAGAVYQGGYTPDDVLRLRNMVADNLDLNHRFVCFSDMEVPCERIPLKNDWPGWWSKIELFSEVFPGNVLYFDLDTVICGDLKGHALFPHKFTMLRDFGKPEVPASGYMAWNGDYRKLYERFAANPAEYRKKYLAPPTLGDQAYIAQYQKPVNFWQDEFPDEILSYKFHCRGKAKPDNAKVVCFHGNPKGSGSSGWVKEIWSNSNGSR